MYALERLFYSVAALTALAAIVVFGMFFDIGDMILAAFKGPGAFAEWNNARGVRAARRMAIDPQITHDGSSGGIYQIRSKPRDLSDPGKVLYQIPHVPLERRLEKAKLRLSQQGFTDNAYLEMEAYYRVDRGHGSELLGVQRLMTRGNHFEALDRLDVLLARLDSRNMRAIADLLQLKIRLVVALQAPPEEVYELLLQRLELLRDIARVEVSGYTNVPRYAAQLADTQLRLKLLEDKINELREKRNLAVALMESGIAYGKIPPQTARVLRAELQRHAEANPQIPQEEIQKNLQWIDTRAMPEGPPGGG